MIAFDEETHRGLETGLNALTDAVKVTLGLRGRNVVPERKWGAPLTTDNDISITHEIELEDPYERIGARLVKEVAKKTDDVAGDSTTTAAALAQTLVSEGLRNIVAGSNPMGIKRGIGRAVTTVTEKLLESAKDIETKEQIAATAGISATDPAIDELIATTMDKVGKEGIITMGGVSTFGLNLELTEGIRFDKGYISGYFATDMEHQETALEDPYILLVSGKIPNIKDPLPLLERVIQSGKPLLIIAEDVEGEALSTLVIDKIRDTFKSVTVKAPGFGDRHKAMLQDVVILTDDQVISEEVSLSLETTDLPLLGRTRKVVVTKDGATIAGGAGGQSAIEGHVDQVHAEIENSGSDYDKEKLQERLTKLAGGVAVIKTGTATKVELKEHKHRVEDAVRNTEATAEEGIVTDGDSTLLQVSHVLDDELGLTDDEVTGVRIVHVALTAPLCQIALNTGLKAGVVTEKVTSLPQGGGLNAATGEYIDLMGAGINDPVKVTRSTLQNAASIAALFPATETVIANKPRPAMPAISGGDEAGGIGF